MKTAISLPDPLFEAADRLATRMGISRSELFQQAMLAFIREHTDEGVIEALNQVYGPGAEQARLDPVLEYMQLASLPEDDWD